MKIQFIGGGRNCPVDKWHNCLDIIKCVVRFGGRWVREENNDKEQETTYFINILIELMQ